MSFELIEIGFKFVYNIIVKPFIIIADFTSAMYNVLQFLMSIKYTHKELLVRVKTIILLCMEVYVAFMVIICFNGYIDFWFYHSISNNIRRCLSKIDEDIHLYYVDQKKIENFVSDIFG